MTIASFAVSEWQDRLGRALQAHHLAIDPRTLMEVLADAAEPAAPLTQSERDFLTGHVGLTTNDLTSDTTNAVDVEIATNRASAARAVRDSSYSTKEVAEELGMDPANVRRAVAEGSLYSVKTGPNNHHWFPMWQFSEGQRLPGLKRVIAALPDNYHPVEVEEFMTGPAEALRGRSPADWLASGGSVDEVVALADERAWE
jgi:hypothetical protein